MAADRSRLRNLLAVLLLMAVAMLCVSLGRWQLGRAAERDALARAIDTGRQAAPLTLNADNPAAQWQEWRTASVRGIWLDTYSVLLDNRNLNGQPGMWLATPLKLADAPDTAVLVLRGWLPRPIGQRLPTLPPPAGTEQQLTGHLLSHVPRLYELWQFDGSDNSALPDPTSWRVGSPPIVQNLALARFEQATGLKLLPIVLAQTDPATESPTLQRDWPTPSLDADKNRGYALQWFGFATLAGLAAALLLWRTLRAHATRAGRPQ